MKSANPAPRVLVRPMLRADLPQVLPLCHQLGYELGFAELERNFAMLLNEPASQHALFVAIGGDDAGPGAGRDRGPVIGWVHAQACPSLISGARTEIGGLVVDERHRGQGAGRALMEAAERWGRERGCPSVLLRSNIKREAAHRFYQGIGYAITKTSLILTKELEQTR